MKQTTKEILEIEHNEEILSERFSYCNYHFWPLIRYEFLAAMIASIYGIKQVKSGAICRQSPFKLIRYIFLSFLKRPSNIKRRYDFIYFGPGSSNIRQGNYYLNRLTDYYYNVSIGTSVVIEDSFNYNYRRPRSIKDLYYLDWIRFHSKLRTKFEMKFCPNSDLQSAVDDFIQFLKINSRHSITNEKYDELRNLLLRRIYEMPFLVRYYSKLIHTIAPRAIFINGCCYGSYAGILANIAKKMNVCVLEIQHGMVASDHIAYNYFIKDINKYRQYLPDYFLTFGKYWSEIIELPVKRLEIGHPYLEESLNLYKREKQQVVLFVSSSLNAPKETQFVIALKKELDKLGYQLYFRIHPLDYDTYQMKYKDIIHAGILIDRDNLYKVLSVTKYVIGEVSTVLYEALKFRTVIMGLETDYSKGVNPDFVNVITTVDDVVKLIRYPVSSKVDVEYFWKENWEINFKCLLTSILNKNNAG